MTEEQEAYVGIHEAAEITGYSLWYLRDLCRAGKIPFSQTADRAHYRFLVSELRAWLRGEWEGNDNA